MSSSSSMESRKVGDRVSEPINEELRYLYASNVNVSNFVSASLAINKSNYTIWKKQMLCLLDSQNLRFFVDAKAYLPPEIKSPNIIRKYKRLVEGWIYGSLNEHMLKFLVYIEGPREIWSALETICDPDPTGSGSLLSELPKSDKQISEEELKYLYASNVDVSNFVSGGLLTESNYTTWRKEMLCLLDSENLRGFIDDNTPWFESQEIREQYESLVNDWILRWLNEDMKRKLRDLNYPCYIWREVERIYDPKPKGFTKDRDSADYANYLKELARRALLRNQEQETTNLPVHIEDLEDLLFSAVVDGRWLEAKLMLKNNKEIATRAITEVLHLAVKERQNNFLEWLLDFIDDEKKIEDSRCADGRKTALHTAAEYNNKRAAQLLVKKCRSLLFCEDNSYKTPLMSAYDFKSLDTFLYLWELVVNDEQGRPGEILGIPRSIDFDILEDAISTKQYDIASRLVNTFPQVAMQDDRLLMAMARTFPSDLDFGEALIRPSLKNFHQRIVKRSHSLFNARGVLYAWAYHVLWATRSLKEAMWLLQETVLILLVVPVAVLYPLYQLIRLLILVILYPFIMLYFLLWTVLAIAVMPIKRVETKKKKYQEAKEFLNIICNHIDKLAGDSVFVFDHPCYSRPFMEAIRQDAYEVVVEILSRPASLIFRNSLDEKYHTLVELAITNRSHKTYNLIYHLNVRKDEFRKVELFFNNNILHLAGRMSPIHILSRTTGAALQLQRELQWFQEVEKLMLPVDLEKKNADMETPHMLFTREHTDLVKEGEQWMKTTSEACSITAALIVTIVFAAAITVPGGNNQETGIPLFKKEIAFIIFAVCDAISLFLATSALLVFLSILNTRFAEMDFLVSLPRRLIIGLCALFLSTTAMMVAFSAILFLVFCDQRPWMLAPIGGLTCMPIAVIVTLQLPLLVDLFKSTYIPIFGKQKYIASDKNF